VVISAMTKFQVPTSWSFKAFAGWAAAPPAHSKATIRAAEILAVRMAFSLGQVAHHSALRQLHFARTHDATDHEHESGGHHKGGGKACHRGRIIAAGLAQHTDDCGAEIGAERADGTDESDPTGGGARAQKCRRQCPEHAHAGIDAHDRDHDRCKHDHIGGAYA